MPRNRGTYMWPVFNFFGIFCFVADPLLLVDAGSLLVHGAQFAQHICTEILWSCLCAWCVKTPRAKKGPFGSEFCIKLLRPEWGLWIRMWKLGSELGSLCHLALTFYSQVWTILTTIKGLRLFLPSCSIAIWKKVSRALSWCLCVWKAQAQKHAQENKDFPFWSSN